MISRSLTLLLLPTLAQFTSASAIRPIDASPVSTDAAFPGTTVALSAFGAVGDGITDDTDALQKALSTSGNGCLDGKSKIYQISGTLRARNNLCLVHATLKQTPSSFDTRPLLRGKCPSVNDPTQSADCGDLRMTSQALRAMVQYTHLRTLFIAPESPQVPIVIHLRDVKIDRGKDTRSGSRTDAAGLWIEGAREVQLENIEITGNGKGFGLLIANSKNVTIRDLNIHDLVWAPYAGDAPLSLATVQRQGWNSVTLREASQDNGSPQPSMRWEGRRVQEQLACVMIVRSSNILLRNTRIANCLARFPEGDLPWQADGLNIGGGTHDLRIEGNTQISNSWEGIDVVGTGEGVDGISISGATISNSFAYGVKWGYRISNASFSNTKITGAGIAGFLINGDISGARVRELNISGIGSVSLAGQSHIPWPGEKAGILLSRGSNHVRPRNITLSDIAVANNAACDVALANRSGAKIVVERTRFTDCRRTTLEEF